MSLKWSPAGAGRDMSYVQDGYQYIIRTERLEYTVVQKSRGGDITRSRACATKQQAMDMAEHWAAEESMRR
jgi:hypothetical protein